MTMWYRYLHNLSHISHSFTAVKLGCYTRTCRCISLFKNSSCLYQNLTLQIKRFPCVVPRRVFSTFLKVILTQTVCFTHAIISYFSVLHHNTGVGHSTLRGVLSTLFHPCSSHSCYSALCCVWSHLLPSRTLCTAYRQFCYFSLAVFSVRSWFVHPFFWQHHLSDCCSQQHSYFFHALNLSAIKYFICCPVYVYFVFFLVLCTVAKISCVSPHLPTFSS